MFLDVSGTLVHMVEMSEAQRQSLALRVRQRRREVFGTKSDAYRQAKLNAATWDRLERGEAIREDRLFAALRTLWPEEDDLEAVALGAGELGSPGSAGAVERLLVDAQDTLAALADAAAKALDRLDPTDARRAELAELQGHAEGAVEIAARLRRGESLAMEGGTHEDLVDPAEKSGDGVVTPLRPPGTRQKAARDADVPDKED